MARAKTTRPKPTPTKVADTSKARKGAIIARFLSNGMVYGVPVAVICYEQNPVAQNQSEDLCYSNEQDLASDLFQNLSNAHNFSSYNTQTTPSFPFG